MKKLLLSALILCLALFLSPALAAAETQAVETSHYAFSAPAAWQLYVVDDAGVDAVYTADDKAFGFMGVTMGLDQDTVKMLMETSEPQLYFAALMIENYYPGLFAQDVFQVTLHENGGPGNGPWVECFTNPPYQTIYASAHFDQKGRSYFFMLAFYDAQDHTAQAKEWMNVINGSIQKKVIAAPQEDGAPQKMVVVTYVNGYLRSHPGSHGAIIHTVVQGDRLPYLGQVGEWYRVEYNGTEAYMHRNLGEIRE